MRKFSFFDRVTVGFDKVVRALCDNPHNTGAKLPATEADTLLTDEQRKQSARLMRVNHAGEVCAQALYHGHALVSKNKQLANQLHQAAVEEGDHLNWCKERLSELGGHTSYLNPVWYAGSFAMGMMTGLIGDKWSLGFIAETEKQVVKHLAQHSQALPREDKRSYQIITRMQADEAKHRDDALFAGANELPGVVKKLMHWTSRVMVKTAYWV